MVAGDAVHDGAVVGDGDALKAELFAKELCFVPRGERDELAVEDIVTGHDALEIGKTEAGFEGLCIHFAELPFADGAVGAVLAARAAVEAQKVLGDAFDVEGAAFACLHAESVTNAHAGDERFVLAVAFVTAAEARIAGDIENGRKDVRDAHLSRLVPHRFADGVFELAVEGRAARHARREAGGIGKEQPAETLHMEDGGDVMGRAFDDFLLDVVAAGDAVLVRNAAEFERGDDADAVGEALVTIFEVLFAGEHVAVDLRHLFVEGEVFEKVLRAFAGG